MKKIIAVAVIVTWSVIPAGAETRRCTTIDAVPVTLTTPGIYCLKGNLTANRGQGFAIRIRTNNVVIDLNGFRLRNTAGTSNTASGILARNKRNIVIRNGTIEGFHRGISLRNPGDKSANHLIETIRAIGNGNVGIHVAGENLVVRNNQLSQTGPNDDSEAAFGILVEFFKNARVSNNTVSDTSETGLARGIAAAGGSHLVVENNMVSDTNTANDTYAIWVGGVTRAHVAGNQLINEVIGTVGIVTNGATGIACTNNYIDAFATVHQTCNSISGTLP